MWVEVLILRQNPFLCEKPKSSKSAFWYISTQNSIPLEAICIRNLLIVFTFPAIHWLNESKSEKFVRVPRKPTLFHKTLGVYKQEMNPRVDFINRPAFLVKWKTRFKAGFSTQLGSGRGGVVEIAASRNSVRNTYMSGIPVFLVNQICNQFEKRYFLQLEILRRLL